MNARLHVIAAWQLATIALLAGPAAAQEAAGQKAGAPRPDFNWEEALAAHQAWLTGLGDPLVLDLVGLDFLSPASRTDPRRIVLRGSDLRGLNAPGAILTASDLSGSALNGAKLAGADLSHTLLVQADLSGANLENARLKKAQLTDANLSQAVLTNADLSGAHLRGANLRGANLIGADLSEANLIGADLTEANLIGANLTNADLSQAVLSGADLHRANLSGAQLFKGDLRRARINNANLSGAQLFGVDFSEAFLVESDLSGVNLTGAVLRGTNLFANKLDGTGLDNVDLAGVIFEPTPEKLAYINKRIPDLAHAKNLGLMTFLESSEPLEDLRRMLKKQDYSQEVLQVTYAIRRGQRQKASMNGTVWEQVGSFVQWIFIELPIEYGAAPLRPLLIVFLLIFVFGVVYMIPLIRPSQRFGEIWRISPRGRFFRFSDGDIQQPIVARSFRDLPIAFWFSFLSALNIGGRMFNIDDVFINCQKSEYYLRPTGWVRTLCGVQAIITIYLFVLTLLIFFEKITF